MVEVIFFKFCMQIESTRLHQLKKAMARQLNCNLVTVTVLLVLFAAAAAMAEEHTAEGQLLQVLCGQCVTARCRPGYCRDVCSGVCPMERHQEAPVRLVDQYCYDCFMHGCPRSCKVACNFYCRWLPVVPPSQSGSGHSEW